MYIIFKQELARQNKMVESTQHLNWLNCLLRGLSKQMRYVFPMLKDVRWNLMPPPILWSFNSTTIL
jgi:hypothetical protein